MSYEKVKENINSLHEDDICLSSKTMKIFGEIDSNQKDRAISNLHLLDQTTGEVTILISSTGGDVSEGLAIIDAIRAMKCQVRIIAYGEVSSMASVIFQAADEGLRYMMPNSFLMVHEGEAGVIDKKKNKQQWERLQKHQDDVCDGMLLNSIKKKKKRFTMDALKKKLEVDWILLPEEAVEWGLADEVMESYY